MIKDKQRKRDLTHGATTQGQLDGFDVQHGYPALRDETLLCDIQIEEIQRVVDGLDLSHLDEPVLDVLRCSH